MKMAQKQGQNSTQFAASSHLRSWVVDLRVEEQGLLAPWEVPLLHVQVLVVWALRQLAVVLLKNVHVVVVVRRLNTVHIHTKNKDCYALAQLFC